MLRKETQKEQKESWTTPRGGSALREGKTILKTLTQQKESIMQQKLGRKMNIVIIGVERALVTEIGKLNKSRANLRKLSLVKKKEALHQIAGKLSMLGRKIKSMGKALKEWSRT